MIQQYCNSCDQPTTWSRHQLIINVKGLSCPLRGNNVWNSVGSNQLIMTSQEEHGSSGIKQTVMLLFVE